MNVSELLQAFKEKLGTFQLLADHLLFTLCCDQ